MQAAEETVNEVHAPQEKTPSEWQNYWTREKVAADKRVEKFIKDGNRIVQRFVDEGIQENIETKKTASLNLFHKNVKTTLDMLYGQRPKVDVSREHKDPDDDPARVAAYLLKRMLEAGCADPTMLRAVLQDRLLPGLGVARVRYDVTTAILPGIDGTEQEVVAEEYAHTEYVHWQDFRWGWGRTWDEIPWIGFRVWLPKEDAIARFGEKVAGNLQYKTKVPGGTEETAEDTLDDQKSHTQEAEIWEFWHKREKKVFWWSEGVELLLDAKDDPLQLKDFWPVPRPLTANLTTSLFLPTADFKLAQDLYNEIDILQTRISILTEAVKVVGCYDKSSGSSVGRMLIEAAENELVPVDNWAMFAEGGGVQGKTDWFPVEQVANVLNTLTQVQQGKIQQLYEITGMSTLMRGGETGQYTSDGTNKLSAKFGSISIQALQDEFARFASELQALKAEIINKHFLPRSIMLQANAQYIPAADKPLLPMALEVMKSASAHWRIEISPESVAMVDYAQLQNERISYLNALATFLQSSQAMLKQVPQSMPVLLEFMKFGLAGFKGADYLEGMLDQAIEMAQKQPAQGGEDQGGGELQKEQLAHQNKLQQNDQKFQQDMQREQQKAGNAMQQEMADHQNKMQLEQQQHTNTMKEMFAEFRNDMKKLRDDLKADLQREQMQSTMAIAEEDVRHEHNMTEQRSNASMGSKDQ